MTKIANNPDVREFILDQRILEQRQDDGEQVYSSPIRLRAAGGEVKVQLLSVDELTGGSYLFGEVSWQSQPSLPHAKASKRDDSFWCVQTNSVVEGKNAFSIVFPLR